MLAHKIDAYTAVQKNAVNLNDIVETHESLVRRIAFALYAKLVQQVSVDDLIQEGMIGLFQAAKNYNPNHKASFETFAGIRIRGAMIDSLRKSDWTPRSVSKNNRDIQQATKTLSQTLGRLPLNGEIAIEMSLSMPELAKMQRDIASTRIIETDDLALTEATQGKESNIVSFADFKQTNDPGQVEEKARFQQDLVQVIKNLPEKDALVISLYYQEEINLKEIGLVLDVSEARVCQILKAALAKLRSKMTCWINLN